MPSLTPAARSAEATAAAFYDGLVSGALTLIPSTAAVYTAMRNSKFRRATNWQSRTAIAIMPPLFMFAITSEMKLSHKMEEMASESTYAREVNDWAEKEHVKNSKQSLQRKETEQALEKKLHALYTKSVEDSGVRIVPGDTLGVHHKVANFGQDNPFKILSAVGIPTVLYIFSGRNEQKHLQLQSKLMHTRVFGQFAIISMLLGLMGFKTWMDSTGKYITQKDADLRVKEMKEMRAELLRRIEFDKQLNERRKKMLKQDKIESAQVKAKKVDVISIENA